MKVEVLGFTERGEAMTVTLKQEGDYVYFEPFEGKKFKLRINRLKAVLKMFEST